MTTLVWSGSLLPSTGTEAIFMLKTALVNAGWIVVSSSDGSSLSAGDVISSTSVLANSNAYFIIKQPTLATSSYGGVRREFGFQRGSNNTNWKVDYTVSSSHWSGGSATTMPTGGDAKWVFESPWQTGTNAVLFATDGTYRFHICTDTAPPYGFYGVSVPVGGGDPNCMMFDPLYPGSFAAADPDPTVQWFQGDSRAFLLEGSFGGSNASQQLSSSYLSPRGWFAKTTISESYCGMQIPFWSFFNGSGGATKLDGNVGTNHIDGTDNIHPVYYVKGVSAVGGISSIKGISSLLSGTFTQRTTGDTLSVNSSQDMIVFKSFAAVWDGSTPSV